MFNIKVVSGADKIQKRDVPVTVTPIDGSGSDRAITGDQGIARFHLPGGRYAVNVGDVNTVHNIPEGGQITIEMP